LQERLASAAAPGRRARGRRLYQRGFCRPAGDLPRARRGARSRPGSRGRGRGASAERL